MWRQQHVVGHHAYTNIDNYDPDMRKLSFASTLNASAGLRLLGLVEAS